MASVSINLKNYLPSDINVLRMIYQDLWFSRHHDVPTVPFNSSIDDLKRLILAQFGFSNGALEKKDSQRCVEFRNYIDVQVKFYKDFYESKLKYIKAKCSDVRACFFVWYSLAKRIGLNESRLAFSSVFDIESGRMVDDIFFFVFFLYRAFNIRDYGSLSVVKDDDFEDVWNDWVNVKAKGISLGFLDVSDDVQCEWMWSYLSKISFEGDGFFNYYFSVTPSTALEKYINSMAIIDVSSNHDDTKRIIVDKCSRAWSQRKYRESKKDKAPINTYISKKAKKTLDRLVVENGSSIEIVIEKLILDAGKRGSN